MKKSELSRLLKPLKKYELIPISYYLSEDKNLEIVSILDIASGLVEIKTNTYSHNIYVPFDKFLNYKTNVEYISPVKRIIARAAASWDRNKRLELCNSLPLLISKTKFCCL